MNINLKKNQPKKSPREYHTFNLDGREFLRTIALPRIESYQNEVASKSKIVILMNLPELALTFLDVVSQWLSINREEKERWMIIPIHIYCYTFSRVENRVEDIRTRLKAILPEINTDEVTCRFVRQVAPNKDMMCANIHLFETT